MSSAAQALPRRRRLVRSMRTERRIRHWTLRGAAIVYLAAFIAIPAAAVIQRGYEDGLVNFRDAMASTGAWEAIVLSLWTAVVAAVVNGFFGTMLAFALVRYRFPGRAIVSSIVDLPLAIPTLVTGVMLVAIYGPTTPIGKALEGVGIQVAFAKLGVLLALIVVTLPFVVRTVQPVLQELDEAEEEAAATLGATAWTTFRRIILPALRPAIAAGSLLVFARCLGEFGSVAIVSGNIPGDTVTAPIFIFQLTSQFRPEQAAAVATVLFAISFVVVLVTTRIILPREAKEEEAE